MLSIRWCNIIFCRLWWDFSRRTVAKIVVAVRNIFCTLFSSSFFLNPFFQILLVDQFSVKPLRLLPTFLWSYDIFLINWIAWLIFPSVFIGFLQTDNLRQDQRKGKLSTLASWRGGCRHCRQKQLPFLHKSHCYR